MKFLLNKQKSKKSTNVNNSLSIALRGRKGVLPIDEVISTLNENEQYLIERETSTKFRLTCTINPICSNVLFNSITEIVKDEGSAEVKWFNLSGSTCLNSNTLTYKVPADFNGSDNGENSYLGVRDTQLSNKKNGFIYHCGLDIFNNHLLRSTTFKTICKAKTSNKNFNTIEDFMRSSNGDVIKGYSYNNADDEKPDLDLHVYLNEEINSFKDTINNKLKEENGWWGFTNVGKLSPSDKDGNTMDISKVINNQQACNFIDMYPTRDLFSFTPKYNLSRKRLEKNWDYCLTYPSSSTTKMDFIHQNLNSLKAIYIDDTVRNMNGISGIKVFSISKHGLREGDYVNLYRGEELLLENVEVKTVYDDYVFFVANPLGILSNKWHVITNDEFKTHTLTFNDTTYTIDDKRTYIINNKGQKYYIIDNKKVNISNELNNISYKRVINGEEVDYYVRIFSRLPNWRFANKEVTEYEMYRNGSTFIEEHQTLDNEFENHIANLAFSKNIYNDDISQIVFTDDIDLEGLRDNLGRPLTSIYFTILKNNKGYKEWYGKNNTEINTQSDIIEYSHCFGKLNCAFRLSKESLVNPQLINVMTIENINDIYGLNVDDIHNICSENPRQNVDDDEIVKNDIHFYGDLCCYSHNLLLENVIQEVEYRFNTAQRELKGVDKAYDLFDNLYYDEIISDDYDINNDFQVKRYSINKAHQHKEGYCYFPHYEIKLRELSDNIHTWKPVVLTIKSIENVSSNTYNFQTMEYHFAEEGDILKLKHIKDNEVVFYNVRVNEVINYRRIQGEIIDEKGNQIVLSDFDITKYRFIKLDEEIPRYAQLSHEGSPNFIWREVINNNVDSAEEVYPFLNGAFYVEKQINFFLRRQDPFNWGGMQRGEFPFDKESNVIQEIETNNYYNEEEIIC